MEYEYNEPAKRGHGVLALLFGILSIAITIFVGILFGLYGLIPAIILAILAIVLGILTIRGGNRGKGGVITGTIGIIFALLILGLVLSIGAFLRTDEVREKIPTLSAYADDSWRGIAGLFMKMKSDNVDLDKINAEIEVYNNSIGIDTSTGAAGAAASAATAGKDAQKAVITEVTK